MTEQQYKAALEILAQLREKIEYAVKQLEEVE